MKKELLFRALNDVGDDLLHMAENRRFANPWKKWASLAACLVLIVSLSVLALPYFPMGCGASVKTEEAPAAMEESAAAPEAETQENTKAEAPAEETPVKEEALEEEAAVEEPTGDVPDQEAGTSDSVTADQGEADWFVVCDTLYYVDAVLTGEEMPRDAGDYLGDVTDAAEEELLGCSVYADQYAAVFSNHAVNGQIVTQYVYVDSPNGWILGMTANEKTVSRYAATDVQNAIDTGDTQWIIDTFVKPVQAQGVDLLEGGAVADSETLNGLFLASLQLNTGTMMEWVWRQEDGSLLVHPADITRRLSRFLDTFDYDPTETDAYDPETGMLRFSEEEWTRQAYGLYLKRASVEGDRVWLWVGLPESEDLYDEMMYELRFDEDSWRYINIATPG